MVSKGADIFCLVLGYQSISLKSYFYFTILLMSACELLRAHFKTRSRQKLQAYTTVARLLFITHVGAKSGLKNRPLNLGCGHRNHTSRSRIVQFLQNKKVGKAFSFCSAPKTGLAKYFAGLVSYDHRNLRYIE
jgi:hypothetical protein